MGTGPDRWSCVGLLLGAPPTHAQEWTEGKHYFEIKPAQRPPDAPAGVIEVTEVFSYGCIHCNRATPLMEKIKKSLPSNARLGYLPASFNSSESWPCSSASTTPQPRSASCRNA